MSKEIIKYPNPILKKKSEEVKEITEEIKNLSQKMVEMMIENEGIGLAAPQAGELKRIIVVQTDKGAEVFINPKIIARSKETELMEEGCLSFPKLFLKIKRAKGVQIETLTLEGQKLTIKTEGLMARVFQHEIDHLDGVLFIDRISFSQKLKTLFINIAHHASRRFN